MLGAPSKKHASIQCRNLLIFHTFAVLLDKPPHKGDRDVETAGDGGARRPHGARVVRGLVAGRQAAGVLQWRQGERAAAAQRKPT